jgi:hypothetical protein
MLAALSSVGEAFAIEHKPRPNESCQQHTLHLPQGSAPTRGGSSEHPFRQTSVPGPLHRHGPSGPRWHLPSFPAPPTLGTSGEVGKRGQRAAAGAGGRVSRAPGLRRREDTSLELCGVQVHQRHLLAADLPGVLARGAPEEQTNADTPLATRQMRPPFRTARAVARRGRGRNRDRTVVSTGRVREWSPGREIGAGELAGASLKAEQERERGGAEGERERETEAEGGQCRERGRERAQAQGP